MRSPHVSAHLGEPSDIVMSEEGRNSSSAERLASAVREIVHESLGHSADSRHHAGEPTATSVIWVCVICANVLLVITELPESFLKNTSLEFASKLVGYVFGGVLLLYSSWIRERLVEWRNIRWFRVSQIAILVVLIASRLPLFAVYPKITPLRAQVFVDGETVRPSRPVWLSFGNHTIRIATRTGDDRLQDGTLIQEHDFVLTWQALIRHKLQGRFAPHWSPLYPAAVAAANDDTVVTMRRQDDALTPELLNAQPHDDVELTDDNRFRVRIGAGAQLLLPLGDYVIQEERSGRACAPMSIPITEATNNISIKPCVGQALR